MILACPLPQIMRQLGRQAPRLIEGQGKADLYPSLALHLRPTDEPDYPAACLDFAARQVDGRNDYRFRQRWFLPVLAHEVGPC